MSNLRLGNPMMSALMPMLTPLLQGSVGELDAKLDSIVNLLAALAETQRLMANSLSELVSLAGGNGR